MGSSNVSSVTKYFVTANEGFNTTLGSTIVSGATSVPLNSTTGLTNGTVFVGIIEPGATAQQVFTGTVDVSGSQITSVVWTRGTNTGHAGGVTIVDYSTGTARNMATTGILKQHTQAGAHTGLTTDTITTTGNTTVGGALTVLGSFAATGLVTYADLLSTIFSGQITTGSNGGTAGGTTNFLNLGGLKVAWGTTAQSGNVATNGNITMGVTFPTTFAAAPLIVLTAHQPTDNRLTLVESGLSTSALTILVQSNSSSNNVTSAAHWIALGT